MKHPLHQGKEYPTTTVLRDLASQENCDGTPYDQMIEAADQIDRLTERCASYVGQVEGQAAEIERLRVKVAAYKRLAGGVKQMIANFDGCSVIGTWVPYGSDSEP